MEASEIIKSFCGKIGIAYEPDKYGTCMFEADGLHVAVTDVREIDSIGLVGDLGEPPPERLENLYKMMLEANHLLGGTGGATLSLNPDNGRFSLCQFFLCQTTDADALYSETERFVCTLETWTKVIGDFRDVVSSISPDKENANGGMSSSDFITV